MTLTLTPGTARLADLAQLYWSGAALRLDPSARPGVEAAVARVKAAAEGDAPVYGVNTGFGKLAHVRIPAGDTALLQRNLILSHCAGVDFANITEFRRQGDDEFEVEPSGRIELGKNEIPQAPDDPDDPADQPYLGGLQLTLEGGY